MSIKYVGRRIHFFGRPLWEIVLNLKNFGKGRIVVKSSHDKYPAPTFYRILSVHPHIIEYPKAHFEQNMRGNLFTEMVWRGRKRETPFDLGPVAYQPDFRLIHKDEEEELFQRLKEFQAKQVDVLILPRTAPLPPLWKEILLRENKISPDETPEMELFYNFENIDISKPRRIAEEGEEPSFRGVGLSKSSIPKFYETVIWNREEAKAVFSARKPQLKFVYEDKTKGWIYANPK